MNILLIASSSAFNEQVISALEKEGHMVAVVSDREDFLLPARLRSKRLWRYSRRIPFWRRGSNRAFQRKVLMEANARPYDLLLALKGMTLQPDTLAEIRRMRIPTACWFPDNAANEPYASWVWEAADHWDWFFSFDSAITEQMPTDHRAHVRVLPFGVDPSTFAVGSVSDDDRHRYACDVCFIGAPYPDRIALLDRIASKVDLRIWGWQGWKQTTLAKYWRGPLSAQESAKAYRLAKICVNTNVQPHAKGVNLKTFEIAAAGGFQLTDDLPDLEQSFVPGKEIETFHDPDEFEEKIRCWLDRDEERKKVAEAGQERVLKDHTLRARIRQLITTISGV